MLRDVKPMVSANLHKVDEDGLCLLLDPEWPAWAVVNFLGKELVSLCDGRHSMDDLARFVSQNYNADFKTAWVDTKNFIDELSQSEIVYFKRREYRRAVEYSVRLRSLYLEITKCCNLSCAHCFVEAGQSRDGELTTGELKQVMNYYSDATEGGLIVISGGEPLMRQDCLELLSHAVSRGLKARLVTNGILIDREIAGKLASLGVEVQVSLDGATKVTNDQVRGRGSFERTIGGIRLLLANGLSETLFISMTPTKANAGEISNMIQLLAELGISILHISPLNRIGRAASNWKDLGLSTAEKITFFDCLHQKSKEVGGKIRISGEFCDVFSNKLQRILNPPSVGCSAGADLTVNSKGDIYPCSVFASAGKYCLGNVKENTFDEVYKSETLKRLRSLFPERLERIERCKNCMWKHFCGGGCAARSLCFHGTVWKEDDLCDVTQHLFRELVFEIAKEQRATNES